MRLRQGLSVVMAVAMAGGVRGADWPQFRGAAQTGCTAESAVTSAWPKEGPRVLWRTKVGAGQSSLAVVGERVYTQGHVGGKDQIVCLNAADGKFVWTHSFEADLLDTMHEGGPAATPAVLNGVLYALSRDGQFFALNAGDGKVLWTAHLQKEHKAPLPFFGFTFSPFIVDGKVLFPAGKPGSATIALQLADGNSVWKKGEDPAGYATPVLHAGTKCAVILNGGALVLQSLADGAEKGRYPFENPSPMHSYVNASTPLVHENGIFISAAYGMGSARVDVVDAGGTVTLKEKWKTDEVSMQYSTPVLLKGHVYGFHTSDQGDSGGELVCMEWETGRVLWRQRNPGRGMLIGADGKLLMLSRGGELILAEANPEKYVEISRTQIVGSTCRTDPVLAHGQIYVRTSNGDVVCLDVK